MPLGGGAGRTATLTVKVVSDASQAARGLDQAAGGVNRFQSGINRAATYAAIGGAALIGFGKSAFDAASQAEQAGGAVDAVFKENAGTIHRWAKDAADDAGLSSSAYEQMASVFGAQLKNMGVATEDLAPQTDELIGLGADLAAQFGGSSADAVQALSSLLRGERDPIERYGVSIKQADIEARKAAMGLDNLTGEADKQATTQATLSLLYEQTADATGAFARESETAAGAQARASASFENAKAALGNALLPIVSQAARAFSGLAGFIQENVGVFQALAVVAGVLAATILAVKVGTAAWSAAQKIAKAATLAWQAAQWLLNVALSANPIALVVIAVAALVAGIILAYKNSETFRNIVKKAGEIAVAAFQAVWRAVQRAWEIVRSVWNWIKSNWPLLLAIITGPIGTAVYLIRRHWDTVVAAIQRVITWCRENLANAWRYVSTVVGNVAAAIRGSIQWVIDKLNALWGWIVSSIGNAWGRMYSSAAWVMGLINGAIQWVIDKLNALWGWLVSNMGDAWGAMYNSASWVLGLIRDAIQWVIDKVNWLRDRISGIHWPSPPSWLSNAVGGAWDWITGNAIITPPAMRPRYVAVAAPRAGRRSAGATGGAGGVTINVNGALDPDSVARQIERLLQGRVRRQQGPTLRGVV